ncbi:MAG: HAMP domain-containing protein [Spirochaetes bacterium]|nr:HAMP domain-containing protein [Spirochaetota bacterium]NLJ04201.1 HAMP domain-containing protein [Exilispira sp.]MBP8991557.1 HAMP domain-containing protein [Spirochaetota bacterium]HNV44495.1 adenylate/guanylate cyclase domain-containing protein [Exilispira sp.]HOV45834.1 adenylate/guanylate cyclase domain-containing protein [Exilispira sp.]
MSIKAKILATVIPLIIVPLLFISIISTNQAKIGITKVAQQLLAQKLEELSKKVSSQYDMLEQLKTGGIANEDPEMLDAVYKEIQYYCESLFRNSQTAQVEIIKSDGTVLLGTKNVGLNVKDRPYFNHMKNNGSYWFTYTNEGEKRVGVYLLSGSWDWYLLISENEKSFYADAQKIQVFVLIIGALTIGLIIAILLPIISSIIKPTKLLVVTMQDIIKTHNLKEKAKVFYNDEIGTLTATFNVMTDELDTAYQAIKNYAFEAVVARDNEKRIRTIFQKYVPQEIVDQLLQIKEKDASLLIGKKQLCTIFFSDIRDFTSITESLPPEELVGTLNNYFNHMVYIIIQNHGIVDKFIGDAIMGVYGAPVSYGNDAANALKACFEMIRSLKSFNDEMSEKGKINLRIGMGLSSGDVIAGNIGSEQKMDYTVIGDPVNLASRLEGLTKVYKVPVIISEFTYNYVSSIYPARELDLIRVKGKLKPTAIYQPFETMTPEIEQLMEFYGKGLTEYKQKNWKSAIDYFTKAYQLNNDGTSTMYIERCQHFIEEPPEEDWDGVYVFKTK